MLLFRLYFVLVISFLSPVSRFLPLLDHQSFLDRKLNTEQARTKDIFVQHFSSLDQFGELHHRSSLHAWQKKKIFIFQIKISNFLYLFAKNKKNRKHILNRFEDIVLSVTGFDTNHVSRMIQIFVSWGN